MFDAENRVNIVGQNGRYRVNVNGCSFAIDRHEFHADLANLIESHARRMVSPIPAAAGAALAQLRTEMVGA